MVIKFTKSRKLPRHRFGYLMALGQPWHFAVVESAGVKQDIRDMVEVGSRPQPRVHVRPIR